MEQKRKYRVDRQGPCQTGTGPLVVPPAVGVVGQATCQVGPGSMGKRRASLPPIPCPATTSASPPPPGIGTWLALLLAHLTSACACGLRLALWLGAGGRWLALSSRIQRHTRYAAENTTAGERPRHTSRGQQNLGPIVMLTDALGRGRGRFTFAPCSLIKVKPKCPRCKGMCTCHWFMGRGWGRKIRAWGFCSFDLKYGMPISLRERVGILQSLPTIYFSR